MSDGSALLARADACRSGHGCGLIVPTRCSVHAHHGSTGLFQNAQEERTELSIGLISLEREGGDAGAHAHGPYDGEVGPDGT